jgi:bacterioferritin-associated ferredoxin
MYLCICNAVRQSDLETAVKLGQNFEQFKANTGCARTCGTCLEDAEAMFVAAVKTEKASRSKVFSLPLLQCA